MPMHPTADCMALKMMAPALVECCSRQRVIAALACFLVATPRARSGETIYS
jgi:hypothetical protein